MIDQQKIHTALSAVLDPELEHSIVQLGMVDTVKIDGNRLEIALKLPLPGSPGEPQLISDIKESLSKVEGVKSVEVTTSMMNQEERTDLANRLHGRSAAGPSSSVSPKAQSEASPLLIAEDGSIAEVDPQRKAVGEALGKVMDPEIHLPLTKLGMIKALGIADGDVYIDILLTVPGCPLKDKITNDVTNEIKQNSWVKNVGINFGVMTEQQRQRVAEIVRGTGSKNPSSWKQPVTAGAYADRVIAVCSGKGGVGKSTTTTNLAFALASKGYKVGILDADVYGFSIPRMSGIHGEPQVQDEKLVPIKKGKVQVMSMGYFIDEDAPVIWRGPMLHKAINQFLADVTWDKLDYLLIDLPPGTGDVTLTIAQALPKAEMLIVTTPQPVATFVAGRVAQLAERTKLQLLGVVENMSYYESGGQKQRIFGEGGGKELAEKLKIPFLGEIPLHQTIRERADVGNPVTTDEKSEVARAYFTIADAITAKTASPVHA